MPTSPAAETMPGGAPLKRSSKRPCKYGPRDAEGRCPKKPRATSSTSKTRSGGSSRKRPCKYGPRDAQGRCPKKPKAVREYASVNAAARQAGEVIRSKDATPSQKREAVKVLGAAVAAESGKKIAEQAVSSAKAKLRTKAGRETVKRIAKKAAPVAAAVPYGAAAAGVVYAGGKALTANRRREAKNYAKSQLALTEKRLKRKLPADQRAALLAQYEAHFMKQPVSNPYLGK